PPREKEPEMQFGIFYEHQIPRPWREGDEHKLFKDALEQVTLADSLGLDYAWEVEHHFLEEYSHSSAPEVFLAACSQRTKRIRLGHGITLMPPQYNHPARVAERISTLDLVSDGRVEWGTGESSARLELEGIGINYLEKREMWLETVRETAKMMAASPYPGHRGKYFSMPHRNVVPKPVQKPHPPIWVACSNRDTIRLAARLGIGALTFAFIDPSEARYWVEEYYETFKKECEPIGRAVNPNVAMVTGFMVHEDSETALRRGLEGFQFFGYALAHYYITGTHVPGRFDVWQDFKKKGPQVFAPTGAIGNVEEVRANLEKFEETGVDQVIFIQQGGNNRHEHICEALELFASRIQPGFKERHDARTKKKAEDLAPYIERANSLIAPLPEMKEVPEVDSYPVMMQKAAMPVDQSTIGKKLEESIGAGRQQPLPPDAPSTGTRASEGRRAIVDRGRIRHSNAPTGTVAPEARAERSDPAGSGAPFGFAERGEGREPLARINSRGCACGRGCLGGCPSRSTCGGSRRLPRSGHRRRRCRHRDRTSRRVAPPGSMDAVRSARDPPGADRARRCGTRPVLDRWAAA